MIAFELCQLTFEDLRDNLDLRDDNNTKLCDLCKTKWGNKQFCIEDCCVILFMINFVGRIS